MKRLFLAGLVIMASFAACDDAEKLVDEIKNSKDLCETVGIGSYSAVSTVLKGKANPGKSAAADLMIGFQYSKSAGIMPSNSTTVEAEDADADYNYSVGITGLEPATTYYFRSFVRQNGQDTYGETKSFTTKEVASMLETVDATDIEATKATIRAKVDLADVICSSSAYGFLWGQSEDAINTYFECTEIIRDTISAVLTDLPHKTQYWYKTYLKIDDRTFYGEVKTFTTDMVPVESVSLDKTEHIFNTIGGTLTLNATVLPSDATDNSVEWSSDKEDVATVDQNGNVKAIGNGKAVITVTTKDQGKTASCDITVAQLVTSITLSKTSLSLLVGEEETISVTSVLPDNANDKTYTWSSSDNAIATVDNTGKISAKARGNAIIKATANDGSEISASCAVSVRKNPCPSGAVDLGLSVYWATCNLSESGFVSSPEVYGDYYAWGETETKDNYIWSTYKFGTSSSGPFSKYNTNSSYGTVDNKTVLDPEDDAAQVKLGGSWRMPTDEEWTALLTNCTCTWTTNYNGTGVEGRIVTSNVEGYKDRSIFLPAAGYRALNDSYFGVGSNVYYWSSSLYTDYPYSAWGVRLYSSSFYRDYSSRYFGYSVRPVSE